MSLTIDSDRTFLSIYALDHSIGARSGDIPSSANQYVPPCSSPVTAPSHLPSCASGGCAKCHPSRTNNLCGWLFKTDLVQYYLGMYFNDNNLRLGGHTSEHPASRKLFKGSTPKIGINALDDHCTGDPSYLGT